MKRLSRRPLGALLTRPCLVLVPGTAIVIGVLSRGAHVQTRADGTAVRLNAAQSTDPLVAQTDAAVPEDGQDVATLVRHADQHRVSGKRVS